MGIYFPAPWRMGDANGFNAGIIHAADESHVAMVYEIPYSIEVSDPFLAQSRPWALANARLITAAPELLEALKELVGDSEWGCARPTYLKAKRAIAKAEAGA